MKRVLFLATIIICFSGNVKARSGPANLGFVGYLTLGAGYGDSAGSDNHNAEGAPSSLKILSSYKTEGGRTVVDVGFGVQNYNFVHGSALDKSISASVLELATRYQFENQWQLGLVYNQVFGKGENFYANQADVVLGGLQILREFELGVHYLGRAGGRFMTAINVENETLNMIMIDFQIGLLGSAIK